MKTPHANPHHGFTLIEVLISLALCALLATSTASAIAFAARAERMALRDSKASLMLQSLYAAQRLRPNDLLTPPRGWRIESTTEISKISDEILLSQYCLSVHFIEQESSLFTLRIMDDTP